jgi:hypothetical protein
LARQLELRIKREQGERQQELQASRNRQQQRAQRSEHQKALSTLAQAQRQFFDAAIEANSRGTAQAVDKSRGEPAEKARQGAVPPK